MSNPHLNPVMDEILDRHFNLALRAQAKTYMPSTSDRVDPCPMNRHFIAKALAETERPKFNREQRINAAHNMKP